MDRRINTQRKGHHHGNQHCGASKRQGVGKLFHKCLENVLFRNIGLAHIPGQHALHIVGIAHREGIVQSQLLTDLLDLLRRRFVAGQHQGRITARQAHSPVNQERGYQNYRNQHYQPFEDVFNHSLHTPFPLVCPPKKLAGRRGPASCSDYLNLNLNLNYSAI